MASRGPSLTFFFIGLIFFIGIIILIFDPINGMYKSFLTANGASPDSAYLNAFMTNMSQSKNSLDVLSKSYQNNGTTSIVQSGINIVSGVYSTLAIGFGAIGTLTQLPAYTTNIFNSVTGMLGIGGTIIVWVIITSLGIFLVSKFIKAIRGQMDDI